MRLNFWQWLGVAMLVVGGMLYLMRWTTPTANPPGATTAPPAPATTGPTTVP